MLLPIEQAKSPLTIKVALDRVAKAGLELTPEAMIMILKCTNHKVSIRDVLKMVPEGKEADFKEAICSAVEHREHTEANLERMREIAKIGGFEAEFEEAHAKDKWIGDTYKRTFIAESVEDLEKKTDLSGYGTVICDFDGLITGFNADSKIFIAKSNKDLQANPDLTKYDMVICNFKGSTEFADLTKLPKRMIIKGNIDWRYRDFEKLPDISESIVYGCFDCHWCHNLTSLEGAPNVVGKSFDCYGCENLESLVGAPEKVGGDFNCRECNGLTSLEGAPEKVGGSFECWGCSNLTSLKDAPKEVGGYFDCGRTAITSLEGSPKEVGGYFNCDRTAITSLEGAPEKVGGYFSCSYTAITSLKDAPKEVGGDFYCLGCSNLKSLDGAPKEVGKSFDCRECYNLTSAKGLPMHIGGEIKCDDGFRSEIDKELEKRKQQANQSTLPPNGFSNSGR